MKPLTKKEIKQIQDQRQKPLTAQEDAMEGLENCILESLSIQEEYEQLKKSNPDIDIPWLNK